MTIIVQLTDRCRICCEPTQFIVYQPDENGGIPLFDRWEFGDRRARLFYILMNKAVYAKGGVAVISDDEIRRGLSTKPDSYDDITDNAISKEKGNIAKAIIKAIRGRADTGIHLVENADKLPDKEIDIRKRGNKLNLYFPYKTGDGYSIVVKGDSIRIANEYVLKTDNKLEPYSHRNYIDRRDVVAEIEQKLDTGDSPVFISGMAGIGKTEIARGFAKACRKKYSTVFIRCEDTANVSADGLKAFDRILNSNDIITVNPILRGIRRPETDSLQLLKTKIDLLAAAGEDVLIIVDNFDKYDPWLIEDIISGTGRARLIFTTRLSCDSGISSKGHVIDINRYTDENFARAVFAKYAKADDISEYRSEIMEIVNAISCHTYICAMLGSQLSSVFRKDEEQKELLEDLNKSIRKALQGGSYSKSEKDGKFLVTTPYELLKLLYQKDVLKNDFTDNERQVMGLLSLCQFADYLHDRKYLTWAIGDFSRRMRRAENAVRSLSERGIIQVADDRVYIHPLIKQLVTDPEIFSGSKIIAEMSPEFLFHAKSNIFALGGTDNSYILEYAIDLEAWVRKSGRHKELLSCKSGWIVMYMHMLDYEKDGKFIDTVIADNLYKSIYEYYTARYGSEIFCHVSRKDVAELLARYYDKENDLLDDAICLGIEKHVKGTALFTVFPNRKSFFVVDCNYYMDLDSNYFGDSHPATYNKPVSFTIIGPIGKAFKNKVSQGKKKSVDDIPTEYPLKDKYMYFSGFERENGNIFPSDKGGTGLLAGDIILEDLVGIYTYDKSFGDKNKWIESCVNYYNSCRKYNFTNLYITNDFTGQIGIGHFNGFLKGSVVFIPKGAKISICFISKEEISDIDNIDRIVIDPGNGRIVDGTECKIYTAVFGEDVISSNKKLLLTEQFYKKYPETFALKDRCYVVTPFTEGCEIYEKGESTLLEIHSDYHIATFLSLCRSYYDYLGKQYNDNCKEILYIIKSILITNYKLILTSLFSFNVFNLKEKLFDFAKRTLEEIKECRRLEPRDKIYDEYEQRLYNTRDLEKLISLMEQ